QGIGQTLVTVGLALILTEVLLWNFAKVPFACSYLPGKRNPAITVTVAWGMFLFFASVMAAIEQAAIQHPVGLVFFLAVLGAIFAWSRNTRRETWGVDPIMYEDNLDPAVNTLGL